MVSWRRNQPIIPRLKPRKANNGRRAAPCQRPAGYCNWESTRTAIALLPLRLEDRELMSAVDGKGGVPRPRREPLGDRAKPNSY